MTAFGSLPVLSSSQPSSSPGPATAPGAPKGIWARASGLHRTIACPASSVLPRVEDDAGGPAAEWGREVHRFVECGEATERVAKWLSEITDDPAALRDAWWPGGLHEVPMSLSETWGAAYLEPPVTEDQVDRFFEGKRMRGIADYIGSSLVPHIVDLKTGRLPPELPPSQIPQLLYYGYVWLKTHPAEPGIYLSIDHWPRYPKGCKPTRIGPDYVAREDVIAWFNANVVEAHRLSHQPDSAKDARPGPHCLYCPSAIHCPASL